MAKKLFASVSFSKEGYFRNFASGFSKTEISKIIFEEAKNGFTSFIVPDEDFGKIPHKFLESYYWKTSKNPQDMITVMSAIMPSKPPVSHTPKFSHGERIKIVTEGKTLYGEFHRYGAKGNEAIVTINGEIRLVALESIKNVS